MATLATLQLRRLLKIVVWLVVIGIVLNDGARIITAYTSLVNASRDGLDAAGVAMMNKRKGTTQAAQAVAKAGAVLVAYDSKREANGPTTVGHIVMVIRTQVPGMLVLGPFMNAAAGVPYSRWWSQPVTIDWDAKRTVNLTTGMTIN